jgi:hypothetical protein
MGDAVATNDPITGQGANTASKAASIYLHRILERGDKPFDVQWMHETFGIFWDYAQWVVKWTNSLLVPPVPQILQLMGVASKVPPLAREIANGFNHPPDYAPWWFDPAAFKTLFFDSIANSSLGDSVKFDDLTWLICDRITLL